MLARRWKILSKPEGHTALVDLDEIAAVLHHPSENCSRIILKSGAEIPVRETPEQIHPDIRRLAE